MLAAVLRMAFIFTALALVALAAPVSAQAPAAQPPWSSRDQEARSLFEAGSLAFAEGRYENALEYFRRAHELSGRPQLLFNIGAAAERLRRDEEALEAFREYLVQAPESDQRAAVEARIAILERAVAERPVDEREPIEAAPVEDDPTVSTVPPTEPPARDATGPIVLMVSGGVVALSGSILLGVAVGDVATVENATLGARWSTVSDAYSRSEPMSIASGVALGVGIAAAVGGLVWLAIPTEHSPSSAASIELVPGIGAVALRGRF